MREGGVANPANGELRKLARLETAPTVFWYGKTLPTSMYRGFTGFFKKVCPFVRAIVEG